MRGGGGGGGEGPGYCLPQEVALQGRGARRGGRAPGGGGVVAGGASRSALSIPCFSGGKARCVVLIDT